MLLFFQTRMLFGVSIILLSNVANPVFAQEKTNSILEQLNPNPNLLYVPDNPEQIKLGPTQAITLEQALSLAKQNNRELQITVETLKRSNFALNQAKASLLPKLAVQVEIFKGRDAKDIISDLENGDDPINESPLDGRIELSYDVYTSGRREGRITVAQEQVRLAELEVERIQKQINLEVTLAYYELQETSEQVRIAQAALQNAEITLRDAQLLEKGELGTRFDVIRAELRLATTQQELTDGLSGQDISHRQLVQILSLAESANITTADPIQQKGTWGLSLNDSILLAYHNRVELQQQLIQNRISQELKQVAFSETQPQINLFAAYQLRKDFETNIGFQNGYAVGARLRWDFFDGGAAYAAAQQETSNQTIAQTRFADTRNRIRLEVERSYKRLTANAKNIQTANLAFKLAQESLALARLRFQAGVGIQLDVIAAENELTQSDNRRILAVLNYNRALGELERAVNR